jgi:GNAT superfamily N-acetyltransferase
VGILAYDGEKPVGWAAVAPRADFPTLDRSRILKAVDDLPVWSIPCFFVARGYRRKGIMSILIQAAEEFARKNGAHFLEAYPVDGGERKMVDTFVYTGLAAAFQKAGYKEVERRSQTRPIMRKSLD